MDRDITRIATQGGKARAAKLTPEQRSHIARAAAEKRWAGHEGVLPKARFEGTLPLGGIEIPCAVLDDGTRVLTRIGFIRAIGRKGKAKGGRRYDMEMQLPVFLTANNLAPFITEELREHAMPLPFRPKRGGQALGYRAELLPLVCNVFQDAKDAGVLKKNQLEIADKCRILSRAFSSVGLAALIDEATGYEKVRDDLALQAILDKVLRREFAAWAKAFPDRFYERLFKLRGWQWEGRKPAQGPRALARYTNDLVYSRLAPGVLDELQKRNPIVQGRRRVKHHQFLTEDTGHPALTAHFTRLLTLMDATDDWDEFKKLVQRALPKQLEADQYTLPF
jgi:hypothetical protein